MINKKEREFINSKIKRYRQYSKDNWKDYHRTGVYDFRDQALMCDAQADCLENLLISLDMANYEKGGFPV